EAFSFFVSCDTQEEVDDYWDKLTADGGEGVQCGWLKDRFGVSWQIVPALLDELINDPDPARSRAAMEAMLQMKKIDTAALLQAVS
ncbi:MAG: VOC family protein, partial [Actinomycetota bacterium]